jgi:hypothetical protein
MTFGTVDRLMGTDRRDIILMSAKDARRLPVVDGAAVMLRPKTGMMKGTIQLAPVKSGMLQAYWRRPMF